MVCTMCSHLLELVRSNPWNVSVKNHTYHEHLHHPRRTSMKLHGVLLCSLPSLKEGDISPVSFMWQVRSSYLQMIDSLAEKEVIGTIKHAQLAAIAHNREAIARYGSDSMARVPGTLSCLPCQEFPPYAEYLDKSTFERSLATVTLLSRNAYSYLLLSYHDSEYAACTSRRK